MRPPSSAYSRKEPLRTPVLHAELEAQLISILPHCPAVYYVPVSVLKKAKHVQNIARLHKSCQVLLILQARQSEVLKSRIVASGGMPDSIIRVRTVGVSAR